MLGSWFVLSGELSLGELIVGFGTLALAGFTWWLARQTSQEVTKTEEGLKLTREGIEAQDMPFVVPSPPPKIGSTTPELGLTLGRERFWLSLWNLGKGPGMVTEVSLRTGNGDLLQPQDGQIPVASGGTEHLLVPLTLPLSDLPQAWTGELLIVYSHASGSPYVTVSKVDVAGERATCRDFRRLPAGNVEGARKRPEAVRPTRFDTP
jgi:hypothetical protein